ncbi:hypothetical protein EON66_05850 [archaeon]|nr:MAG: hypothetical protein EON66_05850 [archaeon]
MGGSAHAMAAACGGKQAACRAQTHADIVAANAPRTEPSDADSARRPVPWKVTAYWTSRVGRSGSSSYATAVLPGSLKFL